MTMAAYLSQMILPLLVFAIVVQALLKDLPVFSLFCKGAKEGIRLAFSLLPTLIGLLCAVGVLRGSGFLPFLEKMMAHVLSGTQFPPELIGLGIMKVLSSSAATGLFLDILQNIGPDTFTGRVAAVMMGATETVLYTMSVYFGKVHVTDTRYTLWGALLANIAGMAAAYWAVLTFFPQ